MIILILVELWRIRFHALLVDQLACRHAGPDVAAEDEDEEDKDGRVEEHEHDVACLVKEWLAAVAPARIEEVDERGDIGEKHLDQNNDLRLCRPAEAQSEIAMHMQPGGACRAFAPLGQR